MSAGKPFEVQLLKDGKSYGIGIFHLIEDDKCHMTVEFQSRTINKTAEDFFEAFCAIRRELELESIVPVCMGSQINCYPSGMSRSMSSGVMVYKHTKGNPAQQSDLVHMFDKAECGQLATVNEQKKFNDAWFDGLKKPSKKWWQACG